ncbi:MAG: hypothetical protein K2N34_15455 [Lachnospiraceae bacterium]|nr:hypothetical protein [Lachnospiraceae bacterium]
MGNTVLVISFNEDSKKNSNKIIRELIDIIDKYDGQVTTLEVTDRHLKSLM